MNVLIAMIAGLVGGTLSAVVTFLITIGICQALQVSDREGAVGYLGMFVGLLVGLAGMILSSVMTLRYRGQAVGAIWTQAPSNVDLPDPKSIKVQLQAGDTCADGWWDDASIGQVDDHPV